MEDPEIVETENLIKFIKKLEIYKYGLYRGKKKWL